MGDAEEKTQKNTQVDDAMITGAIDVIATSPFAKTAGGRRIVDLLRSWHAHHRIRYGGTDTDERGSCINTKDLKEIAVNEEYRGNLKKTIPTLVHEGTHATWRHKFSSDKEATSCDYVEDEYSAVVNELTVYEWLRDQKGYPEDFDLETRLRWFKEGTLKASVMARITCPAASRAK